MVDGCPYCFRHAAARAWGPKLPGLLSVLGSYTIIREVLVSHRNQLTDASSTVPRLLLAMSVADVFFSAPYIFTTWAAPKEIENLYEARGSWATCSLQGASVQFGVSTSPFFHLSLSLCSFLMVCFNWPAQRIFRLEKLLHVLILLYGLVATLPFAFYKLYNPTSTVCWIASYPHHCGVKEEDGIDCVRGESASFYRALFAFWPTWPCIILAIIFMLGIYRAVWHLETRNQRYAGRSSIQFANNTANGQLLRQHNNVDNNQTDEHLSEVLGQDIQSGRCHHQRRQYTVIQQPNRQRSRAVAVQSLCYTAAFLLTFSLDTIVLLWNVVNLKASQGLIVAAYILFPLQGFFNVLVYMRTATMRTWEGKLLKRLIFCCGCCDGRQKSCRRSVANAQNAQDPSMPPVEARQEKVSDAIEPTDSMRDEEDDDVETPVCPVAVVETETSGKD